MNLAAIDEEQFYQQCSICMEDFDVEHHEPNTYYEKTPILFDCGHTICYQCFKIGKKKLNIGNRSYEGLIEIKCHICKKRYY